ncbi:MAG: insulinase family protein [Gammaproteobacteria bacterium]
MNITNPSHHDAFQFKNHHHIASLNVDVYQFEHRVTGAQHLHIRAANTENAFLVAFRTVPTDSTGVAHILEHTVLCGSEKFPVRDPFFMMLRRSLNTFMNAFTSSDWTAYPFATQNRKDFFNLLSVYLDATFFSRLHPLDFAQEGHRVAFAEPSNPDSDLVYKGVVFNEMKGSMSAINSHLYQRLSHHLFPSITYHYNSGGDPLDIPDLTHEQLLAFYRSHYHPSNALFFTFGDIEIQALQTEMEDKVLARFKRSDAHITVPLEKVWVSPLKIQEYYGIHEEDTAQKTHHLLAWLLGESANATERLEATLLSQVLLQNSAAPLRHVLETYEYGTAPAALTGLEDAQRQMSFICGVEGSDPEHAEHFERAVFDVLEKVATDGVPHDVLESVCHQIELSQREIGGDHFPYGLQLLLTTLSGCLHGGNPIALLDMDPALKQLRESIQSPDFIKSLAQRMLLNNQHYVRLTVAPDTTLNRRMEAQEKARLAQIKSKLTDSEKRDIVQLAEDLKARQQQKDDESILPKVTLQDVPKAVPIPTPDQQSSDIATTLLTQAAGIESPIPVPKVTLFRAGTNGISYVQTLMALPQLDPELLEIFPLYSSCFDELGVGSADYIALQKRQTSLTGGLAFFRDIRAYRNDLQHLAGFVGVSSKALHRNRNAMIELMDETLRDLRFDETTRIRDLIAQIRASREQSVTGRGHALAMSAASSGLSRLSHLNHHLSGLASIQKLKTLDDSLDDASALQTLVERFATLHQAFLKSPKFRLVISDQFDWEAEAEKLMWPTDGEDSNGAPFSYTPELKLENQAWITNTQVNFCAKAFPTVASGHPDAAPLSVLAGFLRHGFLHRAIREEGGAYGGGASHDQGGGVFRFYSYRDPRLTETLADFDASIKWLLQNPHDEETLEQAILGVIADIDKPASPAGEAKYAFHNWLQGRTPETFNAHRQRVLQVTISDLKRVAETYLLPSNSANIAVVTHSGQLDRLDEAGEFVRYEL